MRLAYGLEEPIGRYLSAQFPELMAAGDYRPHAAVGFVDDAGRLFGALGLRLTAPWDGELSIYAERPLRLTRAILGELFAYPFGRLRLVRLTCHIARKNKRARSIVERLGFRLEGVKRHGFDGRRDAVIYGMTADECPWTRVRDAANGA